MNLEAASVAVDETTTVGTGSDPTCRRLRILLVEDNPLDSELELIQLRKSGFDFTHAVVDTADGFLLEVQACCPDIVLADYSLPGWNGLDALNILREQGVDAPLILVTGALGETTAVECIKQGVNDYVLKDSLARLPIAIHRALDEKKLRDQRRVAEENLAKKVVELARSNQDLEQFAYVASHDLQEPLRMVASYTQLLAKRYQGKLDADADQFIAYAVDGVNRMQGLIRDLLAYSRAGTSGNEFREVSLEASLDQALKNLHAAILDSGASVTHDGLPCVIGDKSQIAQVFQNLIGNSLKYRSTEAPCIHVSAVKKDTEWILSVRDNGIGISPEHFERVFLMFQRLHTREEYPGTGMGLTITKKIVERHGGRIWAESEPGKGSAFLFTLPCMNELQGH